MNKPQPYWDQVFMLDGWEGTLVAIFPPLPKPPAVQYPSVIMSCDEEIILVKRYDDLFYNKDTPTIFPWTAQSPKLKNMPYSRRIKLILD